MVEDQVRHDVAVTGRIDPRVEPIAQARDLDRCAAWRQDRPARVGRDEIAQVRHRQAFRGDIPAAPPVLDRRAMVHDDRPIGDERAGPVDDDAGYGESGNPQRGRRRVAREAALVLAGEMLHQCQLAAPVAGQGSALATAQRALNVASAARPFNAPLCEVPPR